MTFIWYQCDSPSDNFAICTQFAQFAHNQPGAWVVDVKGWQGAPENRNFSVSRKKRESILFCFPSMNTSLRTISWKGKFFILPASKWKTCFNYFSRLCLKKWNWRGYTESDEGTQNLTSAQPFWHSLSLQYQLWHYVKVKGISSLVSFLKLKLKLKLH